MPNRDSIRITKGQVVNVYGSPGPESGITVDIVMDSESGSSQERYNGVHPAFLPTEFDVRIVPGSPAIVSWIDETEGVWAVQWIPVVTDCTNP